MPVAKESLSEAFPVEQPMQTVLILLSIQGVLGAFDNLWNHEIKERLPSRPTARLELTLHALRQVIYAIVFATIGWWRWDGLYAIALATLLTVEIVITLWDFVEEDRARKLSALERVTHGLLTLNYGAVLGLLAIELAAWLAEPSAFTPVDHGALSWLMTFYGAGVLAWALRDAIAVLRLSELRTPKWLRDPIAIQPIQRPMSVLVAGGTGFIGEALCRRLIAEGHHVAVATRNRAKAAHLFGPLARIVEHATRDPAERADRRRRQFGRCAHRRPALDQSAPPRAARKPPRHHPGTRRLDGPAHGAAAHPGQRLRYWLLRPLR